MTAVILRQLPCCSTVWLEQTLSGRSTMWQMLPDVSCWAFVHEVSERFCRDTHLRSSRGIRQSKGLGMLGTKHYCCLTVSKGKSLQFYGHREVREVQTEITKRLREKWKCWLLSRLHGSSLPHPSTIRQPLLLKYTNHDTHWLSSGNNLANGPMFQGFWWSQQISR